MACATNGLTIILENSKHCTPCKTKEKKVESQYYCTDCEAYYCDECFELHTRVPYLAKHIVLKHGDIDIWANLQYKCGSHDRNLEFYCEDHKMLCCHVCVSLQHRSCVGMEYIPEVAKNICEKPALKTMIERTERKLSEIELYEKKYNEKDEVNQQSKSDYLKKIEDYRIKMNNMFDLLQKKAQDTMQETYRINATYSAAMRSDLIHSRNDLQELKQQLTTATTGKEVLIFISLKRGDKTVTDIEKRLSEMDITTNKDNFKPVFDKTVEESVKNMENLTQLQDEEMRQESMSSDEVIDIFDPCVIAVDDLELNKENPHISDLFCVTESIIPGDTNEPKIKPNKTSAQNGAMSVKSNSKPCFQLKSNLEDVDCLRKSDCARNMTRLSEKDSADIYVCPTYKHKPNRWETAANKQMAIDQKLFGIPVETVSLFSEVDKPKTPCEEIKADIDYYTSRISGPTVLSIPDSSSKGRKNRADVLPHGSMERTKRRQSDSMK